MTRVQTLLAGGALATASLLTASPVAGQAVGISYIVAESDHVELPEPTGGAAWARLTLSPSWAVTLTYYSISNDTEKDGTVCTFYPQRINCRTEPTRTTTTLSGFRAAGLHSFRLNDVLRLEAGAGASFNHVDADAKSLDGEDADMLAPNGGQLGVLAFLSAGITPIPSVPATITGSYLAHWVDFTGCSDSEIQQYAPFCTSETFKQFEISIGYAF